MGKKMSVVKRFPGKSYLLRWCWLASFMMCAFGQTFDNFNFDSESLSAIHDVISAARFLSEEDAILLDGHRQKEQEKELVQRLLGIAVPVDPPGSGGSLSPDLSQRSLQSYNIDLTSFALKYIGCQNIETWSDNYAYSQSYSSPLQMMRYVVFRLCPSSSCSKYNSMGCSSGYGEYMIPMEGYLYLMSQYHVNVMKQFCNVCQQCVAAAADYEAQYESSSSSSSSSNGNDNNYNNQQSSSSNNNYNNKQSYYDDDADSNAANQAYQNSNYNKQYDDWSGFNQYWGESGYYYNEGKQRNNNDDAGAGDDANAGDDGNVNDDGGNNYNDDGADDYNYGGRRRNQRRHRRASYSSGLLNSNGQCIFSTVCKNYKSACTSLLKSQDSGGDDSTVDPSNYFFCAKQQAGNALGYIGPHCRSDGKTIGLAFYADAYCGVYKGDTVDVSKYLTIDTSALSVYTSKSCISCNGVESFALVTDDQVKADSGNNIYPACGALFQYSAKCHAKMSSDTSSSYQSDQQASTEKSVCSFIKSIEQNTYNEFGDPIVVDDFNPSRWKSPKEYTKLYQRASPFQLILLIGSSATCAFLLGYILYLYKKLTFKAPWIAPSRVTRLYSGLGDGMYKSDPKWEAGRISRAESGIVSMRTAVSVDGEASQTGGQTEEEIVANAKGRPAHNHKYRTVISSAASVEGGASQTGGVRAAGTGSGSDDDLLEKASRNGGGGSKEGGDQDDLEIQQKPSSLSWA